LGSNVFVSVAGGMGETTSNEGGWIGCGKSAAGQ
jgi:hypothetical protein